MRLLLKLLNYNKQLYLYIVGKFNTIYVSQMVYSNFC